MVWFHHVFVPNNVPFVDFTTVLVVQASELADSGCFDCGYFVVFKVIAIKNSNATVKALNKRAIHKLVIK